MKRILALLALVVLAFSAPALAAVTEGNGEIGFNYGNTQLDTDTGFDSATSMALRGGYFFNRGFEIEGQLASTSDSTDISGTNADGTFRMYMVNGVYNFQTPKEIVPYVLAGLGMADDEVKMTGANTSDSSTAYQLGAGSRFFFGKAKKAAFRVDVAMIQESTFDQTSTHTNVSAGFSWRLGGR